MVGQIDPDRAKIWLLRQFEEVVKLHLLPEVELIFQGTEINIIADGQWYLASVFGGHSDVGLASVKLG